MEHSEGLYRLARVYRPFGAPNATIPATKGKNTTGMGAAHSDIPKDIKNPRLPLAAEGKIIIFFFLLNCPFQVLSLTFQCKSN